MKTARAIVYLEGSTEVETMTLEFRCWEQLYTSIQAIQYANSATRAGLERVINPISQNLPLKDWQIPYRHCLVTQAAKPKPLLAR